MNSEAIGNALGAAPYKPIPTSCRNDLNEDKDILMVVSWLPAEKLLPCGMRVIKVPNGWTPRNGCDDLEVVVLVAVGSVPAERLSPRRMRVIQAVEPLSLSPVSCGGELFKEVFDEIEKRGGGRYVAKGPPVVAASNLLPEQWL